MNGITLAAAAPLMEEYSLGPNLINIFIILNSPPTSRKTSQRKKALNYLNLMKIFQKEAKCFAVKKFPVMLTLNENL